MDKPTFIMFSGENTLGFKRYYSPFQRRKWDCETALLFLSAINKTKSLQKYLFLLVLVPCFVFKLNRSLVYSSVLWWIIALPFRNRTQNRVMAGKRKLWFPVFFFFFFVGLQINSGEDVSGKLVGLHCKLSLWTVN